MNSSFRNSHRQAKSHHACPVSWPGTFKQSSDNWEFHSCPAHMYCQSVLTWYLNAKKWLISAVFLVQPLFRYRQWITCWWNFLLRRAAPSHLVWMSFHAQPQSERLPLRLWVLDPRLLATKAAICALRFKRLVCSQRSARTQRSTSPSSSTWANSRRLPRQCVN